MKSEWILAARATYTHKKLLCHRSHEHGEACVVRVNNKYECWICGAIAPPEVMDMALLAACLIPSYDRAYLERARRDRKHNESRDSYSPIYRQ